MVLFRWFPLNTAQKPVSDFRLFEGSCSVVQWLTFPEMVERNFPLASLGRVE